MVVTSDVSGVILVLDTTVDVSGVILVMNAAVDVYRGNSGIGRISGCFRG